MKKPMNKPVQNYATENSLLLSVGLLLLIVAAYYGVFTAGFLWDDNTFVIGDPQVTGGIKGLWDIWFSPFAMAEFHYWPVLYSTFWLEHKLWGANPAGYHAVNLLLHTANTLILWKLLQHMKVSAAWPIAALFAVHPVHVEAVAWVIARKDLLATLFYLLAFSFWLRFQSLQASVHNQEQHKSRRGRRSKRQQRSRKEQSSRAYLAMIACFVAGMLSKSLILTLPAVLLLWAWWQRGRISGRDVAHTLPLFVIGAFMTALDLSIFIPQAVHEFEYSNTERLIIAAKSLWFYASKLLWPQPLLFMYPHWDVTAVDWRNWLPLLAGLCLVVGLYLARHRLGRGPLAGVLFFTITLSPVLGLLDFGYMKFSFVADRYQYLPGIGLLMVLVGGSAYLFRQSGGFKAGATAVLVVLLSLGTLLSWQRVQVFQNEVGLFRHVVTTNPTAPSALFNLGTMLMQTQPEEAVLMFRQALQHYPEDTQTYINLGSTLSTLGRNEEALAVLQRAIPLQPADFEAEPAPRRARFYASGIHYNIGNTLLELERPQEAEQAFRRALEIDPDNTRVQHALASRLQPEAKARFDAGDYNGALELFRRIVEIDPSTAESHANLGSVLGQLGRYQEAVESFQRALAIDPDMEDVRRNLRVARQRLEGN